MYSCYEIKLDSMELKYMDGQSDLRSIVSVLRKVEIHKHMPI